MAKDPGARTPDGDFEGPPVALGGRLYVRNDEGDRACLDLRK